MSDFKLYEINNMLEEAINEINNIAEDNEGDVPESWSSLLDEIQMERDKKLLDVARYLKSLDAKAAAIKAEEKALNERRKSLESASNRMKSYIEQNITKGEKIEDANTSLSWRKSKRVIVDNEDEISEKYCIVERKIQLTPIKKDIEAGNEVSGAHIEENLNLQIK